MSIVPQRADVNLRKWKLFWGRVSVQSHTQRVSRHDLSTMGNDLLRVRLISSDFHRFSVQPSQTLIVSVFTISKNFNIFRDIDCLDSEYYVYYVVETVNISRWPKLLHLQSKSGTAYSCFFNSFNSYWFYCTFLFLSGTSFAAGDCPE